MTAQPHVPRGAVDPRLQARARHAVEGLSDRLEALLADWGNHAPPRRPRMGHSRDCPNSGRPMRRCAWCRAEALGRDDGTTPATPADAPAAAQPLAELRACTTCYRPTDHPSVLCDRCRTE